MPASAVSCAETPLLSGGHTHGWRSAGFILVLEILERFAYIGIGSNLISYLSGPLGESTADAAVNVNVWSGTASLLPLLGALVADSFLGRFRTILFSSLLYLMGLGLLTLSAVLPSLIGSNCKSNDSSAESCSPPAAQIVLCYFSLYIVAVAQAGHRPCSQAFAVDQFDGQDESKAKSSFFNWWFFGVCAGAFVTISVVSYIQENLNWALGFGIPCVAMVIGFTVFLCGTKTYRYSVPCNEKGPFRRMGRVLVAAFTNRRRTASTAADEEETCRFFTDRNAEQFKFLEKALLKEEEEEGNNYSICSVAEVEEAKAILRLVPIWATCLIYAITVSQISTFFTKQGMTMDRTIAPGIEIPAASLQCLVTVAILVSVPVYDRVLVPTLRSFTGNPSGITTLQRAGAGIFISGAAMATAAVVEARRLGIAAENHGLMMMSVWWLVPQYVLSGIADVFTMVGLQEFFYDEVPREVKSVGLGLYLSIFGVGSFASGFLVSFIEGVTGGEGWDEWFSDDLNRAHLDYFYWLLAGLSVLGFIAYCHFARSYVYNYNRVCAM